MVQRLAEKYPPKEIPIIMLSQYDAPEDRAEAATSGATMLIKKPLTLQKVKDVLESDAIKKLKVA